MIKSIFKRTIVPLAILAAFLFITPPEEAKAQTWTEITNRFTVSKPSPTENCSLFVRAYTNAARYGNSIYWWMGCDDGGWFTPSIYSNLVYHATVTQTDTNQQFDNVQLWHDTLGGSELYGDSSLNRQTPTPPLRHPVFTIDGNGNLYTAAGLNYKTDPNRTFDASTGVNTGTGEITINGTAGENNVTPYTTGDQVWLSTGGTLPTPFVAATNYFIIRVDSTKIKLASSEGNARSGTAITITGTGSGTVLIDNYPHHPNDFWVLNIPSNRWTQHFPKGSIYTQGENALNLSMMWDSARGEIVFHPLTSSSYGSQRTWRYIIASDSMVEITTQSVGGGTAPPVGSQNCLAYDFRRGVGWYFGGSLGSPDNKLWKYTGANASPWAEQTTTTPKPRARVFHIVTWVRGNIPDSDFVFVGLGAATEGGTRLTDAWVARNLDSATIQWDSLPLASVPTGAHFSTGQWMPNIQSIVAHQAEGTNTVNKFYTLGPIGESLEAAPVITADPSNSTVTAPATANFSITATGNPTPTYQWQENTGSGWANISAETSTSYTTGATSLSMSGHQYRCIATNSEGADTSAAATLTVQTVPVVTSDPSNATVTAPATAQFTVTASGSPSPTYQWQKDGVDIGGATSASYTTPATSLSDDGAVFRCIATNAAGADTSAGATLTVYTVPAITVEPVHDTVTVPATGAFSVTATGNPSVTYQWYLNGGAIGGATSSSYTTPATVIADNGVVYSVIVTNAAGADTSANATLTVNDRARVVTNPSNTTRSVGQTASFTATFTGTPTVTYQWQKNNVNIGSATLSSYTTPTLVIGDNGNTYRCIATNSYGADTTTAATLSVVETFPCKPVMNRRSSIRRVCRD